MITKGTELTTFITGLNADATIDPTLLAVLVSTAKTILEEERPWMVLRKTDTSKSVTTSNTWQTAISLATISDFSRFYEDRPLRLFDGTNRIQDYYLRPMEQRLDYKDVSGTACYDANTKTLYLNGTPSFAGTLYMPYVSTSTEVDLTLDGAVWSVFPSRFLPLLGFYAVGVYKGAVDYDSINRQMLPSNAAVLGALKNAMVSWDNELQLSMIETNDPTDFGGGFRNGAIDRG